jgi:hypothetical protein
MLTATTTRPTSQIPAENLVPANAPTSKGLFAKWETVNGKLTCVWLKYPG